MSNRSRHLITCTLLGLMTCLAGATHAADDEARPAATIDYKDYAFFPDRWEAKSIDTTMHAWHGEEVVFLTVDQKYDPELMKQFVSTLDQGWRHYAKLVGKSPRKHKHIDGKTTIAAVPDAGLSCGLGCGYVGATGIEVAGFYKNDYKLLSRDIKLVPHYYFYEMGRNYFVFGNRHSNFTTGFAVLMRYVCLDALELKDNEANLRKKIESAIGVYEKSDAAFADTFTVHGNIKGEKENRLKGSGLFADQPVMYTSAMLKLRNEYGGDAFLQAFFKQLLTCKPIKPENKDSALKQCVQWLVAASCAAEQDLSSVFVDQWRLPLAQPTREALSAIDWEDENIQAHQIMQTLDIQFTDK